MCEKRIDGKVAIVTGGAQGIGQGICLRLADEGAKVAIFDVNLDEAQKTAQEIEKSGGTALAIKVDVTKSGEVEAAVKQAISKLGKVDILVNNAGISLVSKVADMTEDIWDRVHTVNLKGAFLCCRAVIPHVDTHGQSPWHVDTHGRSPWHSNFQASLDALRANTHSPTGIARGTLPFGLLDGTGSACRLRVVGTHSSTGIACGILPSCGGVMKERKYGKIINIASILALRGSTYYAHYGASKAGVVGFTQGLAVELGPHNINVNAVGPGVIDTPMADHDVAPEVRQRLQKRIPLRRIGVPEDIANAVLFLASDEASYITGQCLYVCGGLSADAGLG